MAVSKPMSIGLGEQFWRIGRVFLLLFVLGAAAFLSAVTAMRFAIEGRIVHMPNLVGRTYPEVQAEVHKKNLSVVIADRDYSQFPAGSVVRQSPSAGTEVKVGQQAQVVLSLGQQKVAVPNLVDRSLPAARLQLLNTGLQLGEVSYIYSAGEPDGLILQQDPLPGENGLASPRVSVLVSLGARPTAYVMPDLQGMPIARAGRLLKSAGLQPPQITHLSSPAAGDEVVKQSPAPGARVDQTTPISLSAGSAAAAAAAAESSQQKAGPNP